MNRARTEEAKQTLLSLLDKIADDQEYVDYSAIVEEFSGPSANLTSVLFLVTIRAKGKPDMELFGKVAAMGDEARKYVLRCMFTGERHFYSEVKKQYEKIEESYDVPEQHKLRLPKLFGSRNDYLHETLILDDLTKQGFQKLDKEQLADLEYVSAVIELVAKFHALSLAYHRDYPDEFQMTLEVLKNDDSISQAIITQIKPKLLASAFASAERHLERLEKYFAQKPCPLMQFMDFYRSKNRNILVHGDLKPDNLLHRRRNDKLELVPVDFQLTRDGDPVMDVVYFLFTATDDEFRRAHYHNILDQYYVQLSTALHRLHLDPRVVYSEETYRAELKECSMWGLLIAVFLLPMVLMEEDNVPVFAAEYDMTDLVVETSVIYRRRFNGVLDNYVEWGLL